MRFGELTPRCKRTEPCDARCNLPIDWTCFQYLLSQSFTLVQRTINPWSLEEALVSPTGLVTFIVGSSLGAPCEALLVIIIYLSVF